MASRNCRGRQLKWTICLSDQVAQLQDPWAKLAFTWMIPTVDNLGHMEGEPFQVRGVLFPMEASMTDKHVAAILEELHNVGLIVWYRRGRLRYVWLPKHQEHQKLAPNMRRETDFPEPSAADIRAWENRETEYLNSLSEQCSDNVPTCSDSVPTSYQGEVEGEVEVEGQSIVQRAPKTGAPSDEFDSFWSIYPRKEAKGAAVRAYKAALKKAKPGTIREALEAQLPELCMRERQFVPLPATWLNAERWADDLAGQDTHVQRVARLRQLRKEHGDERVRAMCDDEGLWQEVVDHA